MRGTRARAAIAAAAVACGIAGAAITAGPALAGPAHQSAGRVVIVTCAGKGVTSPAKYIIACADGNDWLTGLNWQSWGVPAKGFGKEKLNTCNPSCVSGKIKTYPVKVELSKPKARPHHSGERYFSKMTLTYTKAIPKGFHKTRVVGLPS